MQYQINSDFKVIVIATEYNKLVDEDTEFKYVAGEIITESSGIKYKVLKKLDDGDLLPDLEYQIIASVPLYFQREDNQEMNLVGFPIVQMSDFSELEGDNPINYQFLTAIE